MRGVLAQRTIECPDCGGAGPEVWIALGALLVASAALWINARQHGEFMRRLRARARFDLKLAVANYATSERGSLLEHEASSIRPVVRVTITNYGEAAATETLVNVWLPRDLEGARWCGPTGTELPNEKGPIPDDEATLDDGVGGKLESQVLATTLGRIPRGAQQTMLHFCFRLPLDESERRLAFHASAGADEMPPDVRGYEADYRLRARRRSPDEPDAGL